MSSFGSKEFGTSRSKELKYIEASLYTLTGFLGGGEKIN